MADLVTLKPGQRIRVDGQSYEVQEPEDVRAEPVEVKTQKNRHLAVICTTPRCIESNGGKPIIYRATRSVWAKGLPPCGCCGGIQEDGTKLSMQPSGWTL